MNSNSRFYFILLSVLSAIGIGNVFLYPYLSAKFGGLFFIAYLLAMIILAAPLLMLEFSIGQYFNKNVVDIFASIRKWLSSIGWLMAINALILAAISSVVLAWNIIYIFVSFGLQWKSNAREYFLSKVAQSANGLADFEKFSFPVFIALILAWLAVYFCVRNGFDSIRKFFAAAMPIFAGLLVFFAFYAMSLDGSLNGIYYFLELDFSSLLDWNLWFWAFLLAAISVGISFGVMASISRRAKAGFILGNSFFIIASKLASSIIMGIIIFGVLGFLSAKQDIGIDGLVSPEHSFPFVVLSQALPFSGAPTLLSILFFLLWSTIIFFGTSALAYSLIHILAEKLSTKRENGAIIVVGIGFLLALMFATRPGIYLIDIISHFLIYNILFAILFECIALGWIYNSEKLSGFIDKNSSIKIGGLWRFFIRFMVPAIVLALIAIQVISDYSLDYHGYPLWAIISFGIGTFAVPAIIAFLLPNKILDRKG